MLCGQHEVLPSGDFTRKHLPTLELISIEMTDSLNCVPSAEIFVLTFVSFESMETCLSYDVHPVYYYINPD